MYMCTYYPPLTGETPESLFKGKLVTCTVVGIVRRKPPREVLDRANPIENKATGYWQCPFCLKDDFRELSMVSWCDFHIITHNSHCMWCVTHKHTFIYTYMTSFYDVNFMAFPWMTWFYLGIF